MGIFKFFKTNKESDSREIREEEKPDEEKIVWRDENGTIRCLGDNCPKSCDETCPIYLNTQAMKLIMMGNGAFAIPIYEKAIKIAPDFYDGWNNLASLYAQSGNYRKAYDCYLKAHTCNPEKYQPLFGLALSARDLEKYEECIEWCDKYEAVAHDNKSDGIKSYATERLKDNGKSFQNEYNDCNEEDCDDYLDFPESTPERRAVSIVKKFLEDERTPEIMDYRGGMPNIPELMMQTGLVCETLMHNLADECESTEKLLFVTPLWCAYAGIGAVAMWNDDWPKLRDNGIVESLVEERGFFAMDEFVIDYIGVEWDSDESKIIQKVFREFSNTILDQSLQKNGKFDMTYYYEALKAMYLYGMVFEMSRLGMH